MSIGMPGMGSPSPDPKVRDGRPLESRAATVVQDIQPGHLPGILVVTKATVRADGDRLVYVGDPWTEIIQLT